MDYSSAALYFGIVAALSILVKYLMYPSSVHVGVDNGAVGKELLCQCYSWSNEWELLGSNV